LLAHERQGEEVVGTRAKRAAGGGGCWRTSGRGRRLLAHERSERRGRRVLVRERSERRGGRLLARLLRSRAREEKL
jgi:hypothetical protein